MTMTPFPHPRPILRHLLAALLVAGLLIGAAPTAASAGWRGAPARLKAKPAPVVKTLGRKN
jgi:hypothetical protein